MEPAGGHTKGHTDVLWSRPLLGGHLGAQEFLGTT